VLEPLARLAARKRVAVVAVTHFSKGTAARAIDRVTGSIAFVAAARSAFMIVKDPAERGRRLFIPLKSNISGDSDGLAFRVHGTVTGNVPTSVVVWEDDKVEGDADEVLANAREEGRTKTARDHAEIFLRKTLGQDELPIAEVKAAAAAAGVSWDAVRRTHKVIGVVVRRRSVGNRGAGQWVWLLPPAG
jgi:hypothetical protein